MLEFREQVGLHIIMFCGMRIISLLMRCRLRQTIFVIHMRGAPDLSQLFIERWFFTREIFINLFALLYASSVIKRIISDSEYNLHLAAPCRVKLLLAMVSIFRLWQLHKLLHHYG